MHYAITVCSTTDLPLEYIKEHNIPFLPYTFIINGKEFKDDFGISMTLEEFYRQVREGAMPTTSQVNTEQFTELFESLLKEGKDILHISLSSAISGSYNSARIAAAELTEKYPERKIYLVDSLCASLAYGLLAYYAIMMKEDGKTIDEVYNWLEANKLNVNHWIMLDNLFHLKRGGRLSGTAAVLGTLLHIKPIITMDDTGHLITREKARGKKQALNELVSKAEEFLENPDGKDAFISHSDCEEDANYVAAQIKQKLPGLKSIMVNQMGPVIGTHAGPGAVALFFLGKHR